MSNIRYSTMRPIVSKKSDPTNKANRIEFATFDPTECTRLNNRHAFGKNAIDSIAFFLSVYDLQADTFVKTVFLFRGSKT